MPNFIITYHGGERPNSPEEGKAHMKKWQEWIASLGEAVVNPGTPLSKTSFVNIDGIDESGAISAMSGYAVVKASDIDEAVKIAKTDPFLAMGGTIGVAQMIEMSSK